ncbi:MAG: bifunctional UDP-N-acetylmuramoyl-tripeptide:D-alanyl-D-alanine ligase/alanine racemase [Bacteroidales bacterium]|nr:bifunctional UDP-N-acetylmuramoyl-tripeptide:D-alanyl-D-alanine ligase/alanine racemase [Bacteroidales bacterium]
MNIVQIASFINPLQAEIRDSESAVTRLCIDSRKVSTTDGVLFFAIKTTHNDGHRFIPELYQKGVRNFIITAPVSDFAAWKDGNFLQVHDAIGALQLIASKHRQQFTYPVIGITGSNGKTIVKEWLNIMMAADQHIVRSPDSYNSQIGVPLSVWQMRPEHTLGIFEAGISQPGEMTAIAHIIQPTIGILTNIGMAHSQFFSSIEEKLQEKLRLFTHAEKIIFNNDNPLIRKALDHDIYSHIQKISWGYQDAEYRISHQERRGNSTLVSIRDFEYRIPFVDAASIENAIHVIITTLVLGYRPEVINERLSALTPIHMRMAIQEGRQHSLILDDAYSLDWTSLTVALNYLDTQTQMPDKALIISDFEQAGTLQQADYTRLNDLLLAHDIGKLFAVGKEFCQHQQAFTIPEASFYPDTETLLADLASFNFAYHAILIKGARNFHFEDIVHRLLHKTHLTTLNVNLPALVHNLHYFRSLTKPETKMVAMVKALSYGLGDAEIINELINQKIDYLAVAYTDEGVRLRKRHIKTPIIVLGAEAHSFESMVLNQLEPEIFNFYYLQELIGVLQEHPGISQFPIHIKLDTGMHRLGFDKEDLPHLLQVLKENPCLRVASVFSHLAAADDSGEDDFTRLQIHRFQEMSDILHHALPYPILRHILNTAGIVRFPEAQFEMVRLGIGLYGFFDQPEVQANLQNVATLKTLITQVKTIPAGETIGYNRSFKVEHDMQVAIIPIGYADGYPREFSNGKGLVMVRGHLVPVVGKICMDMCMLDVTGLAVHEGDEVIVYGEGNTAQDAARRIGHISYDLLTSLSSRVPRIYVKE